MKPRAFRLATLALASVGAAATLTACGGATVDSDDVKGSETTVTETSASAETSSSESATQSSTASSTVSSTASSTATSTASGSTAASSSANAQGGPQDRPAREIESMPEQANAYSAQEQAYLDHLRENGVNIEGVEDQLTATGASVCANDTITRDAVAGQLVEQRRTDMTPEALGQLLTDTARANLC